MLLRYAEDVIKISAEHNDCWGSDAITPSYSKQKKKKILLKLTGNPEVYLGPCQTCKMEFFAKIVKI